MNQEIKYHAYGANGETVKDGIISVGSTLPEDENDRVAIIMDAIALDIGEDRFEAEVVGVTA